MQEIVVGVDGSASSDAALAYAADEAAAHGWRLVAVHTWSLPVVAPAPYAPYPMVDFGELEVVAKEILTRALARVIGDRDIAVEELVVRGNASDVLLARAAHARALVVGSRGHGGLTGALLGSVSQRCAHHASCPVIILPA